MGYTIFSVKGPDESYAWRVGGYGAFVGLVLSWGKKDGKRK